MNLNTDPDMKLKPVTDADADADVAHVEQEIEIDAVKPKTKTQLKEEARAEARAIRAAAKAAKDAAEEEKRLAKQNAVIPPITSYAEFFNMVATNPSRLFKIEQLTLHKDDKMLQQIVFLALDSMTNFGIKKIPQYVAKTPATATMTLEQALQELVHLSTHEYRGLASVQFLSNVLSSVSAADASIVENIITKDLRCGVNTVIANTVWPNLVCDYPVMLCSNSEPKLVERFKYPAYVQLKMDGMRFNAIVNKHGKVDIRSRSGKEIQLLGVFDATFRALAEITFRIAGSTTGLNECVFDGELVVVDNNGIMERKIGNGILNKATRGTMSAAEAAMVQATLWDVIPYQAFTQGQCDMPYSQRFNVLSRAIHTLKQVAVASTASASAKDKHGAPLQTTTTHNRIQLVEHTVANSLAEVNALFETYLEQGQEGIILKDPAGIWENKRSRHQLKFKGELECDLRIVDIIRGTGKFIGAVGALACESADGKLAVNVGSGFTNAERLSLMQNWVASIGKIATIKYNSRIKDKHGNESLFLPIFVEIRDDKSVADTIDNIK